MLSLIIATFCSASIALIFKWTEGSDKNRYVVTSINYLTATLVSFALGGINQFQSFNPWVLIIGIPAGVFFFLSFVWYQISVRKYGAGLAGMFGKLGILLPMVMSLILWKEWPTLIQTCGILLSLFAIVLIQSERLDTKERMKLGLILLFIFGGMAEFSNKIFQQYGGVEAKSGFLMVVFATAGVLSWAMVLKEGKPWNKKDVQAGIAVGIPNLFSSWFLIQSLVSVPTAVAFPFYSAGSMALIMILSRLLFKEHLNHRRIMALGITMIALALMNL